MCDIYRLVSLQAVYVQTRCDERGGSQVENRCARAHPLPVTPVVKHMEHRHF
jgi:hypothetical protein